MYTRNANVRLRVAELMDERGATRGDVAAGAGLSEKKVQYALDQHFDKVRIDDLTAFADYFDVPIISLISE